MREEESRQQELQSRLSQLESRSKVLGEREYTLNIQKTYLVEMRYQGAQRLATLQFEKDHLEETCGQLKCQNERLALELD